MSEAQPSFGRLPRHVAIIMDGNGRWAQARGLPRPLGHAEGAHAVRRVVRRCRQLGIRALTLYTFSTENWGRPDTEVDALMELLVDYLLSERGEILDNNIRLMASGEIDRLPARPRATLDELMAASASNTGMVLNLAISYGGRAELVRAARALARRVRAGELEVDQIDDARVSAELYTAGLPELDLLIRSGGDFRISNFLLWQVAYAELHVIDTLWPDFEIAHLEEALRAYAGRQRRYGLTGAQIAAQER